jgi:dipeptidyl-peptidase-4
MTVLTVERLFGIPPLTGTLPTQLTFSPDGTYLAYLKVSNDDRERLDLWRFEFASGEHRCWLDARSLTDKSQILSDAEKAERERKRSFNTGITSFEFNPNGRELLVPIDGAGHLFDIATETLVAFTPPGTRQTDFRFSPAGHYLSYVRANDLYTFDLSERQETRVTADGSEVIASGIADFIAQEEMHRFSGHWWSEDESMLAYTRVDESPVAVSQRSEIDADAFNVIEQRYPYAGAANALVALKVFDRHESSHSEVDYLHAADDYLARVDWFGSNLAVQVQSRDQHDLYLDLHSPRETGYHTLIHERSDTWINLHDNFRVIDGDRFLWTSERDGASQLYLYSNSNSKEEPTQLTSAPGRVAAVLHADARRVLFSGWREVPTEQHLFSVPLAGADSSQLSRSGGWHEISVDKGGSRAIDRSSSLTDMGKITLLSLDGGEPIVVAGEELNEQHPYFPFSSDHRTPSIGSLLAEDGQQLYYRLTEPRIISGEHPLVVYVYGGPGVHRVKNEWAPLLLQLFAARGFGVLELDNRGSANRGRAFEAPIYRQLGRAEVSDQILGAEFAQSLDWVDADRIGVFGHSYGGYMTLMCLAQAPKLFKAGVAVAPVSEWGLYDSHYTERYLGTPSDNPDGYRESAVLPHLDRLQGKLLIMHGMADDNVLFTHSTKLFKALQSKNKSFEMMTYPGSKHALQEQDVSIHRFNLILDFFERSLKS